MINLDDGISACYLSLGRLLTKCNNFDELQDRFINIELEDKLKVKEGGINR